MKRTTTLVAVAAAAALTLAACGGGDSDDDTGTGGGDDTGSENGEAGADDPDQLILGLVPSQDTDQLVEDAEVLGELLGDELGIPVETFVSDDFAALVVAMQTGQADIGMFGPIALVQAADRAGAVVTLQSVRRDSPTYHTQWFTNDPDTYCLDDIVEVEQDGGEIYTFCNGTDEASEGPIGEDALAAIEQSTPISMVDPSSASGYYYPATQLENVAGLDPLALEVDFAGGHPNSILNVARGDFSVGVSFDDARDNIIEEDPEIGEKVTVFAYSDEIPNDGVAMNGELSEDLIQRISDAMVTVIQTEEGGQAFFDVYSIEDLVPADLDSLDLARQVATNFADEG